MTTTIDQMTVCKISDAIKPGLCSGLGEPEPGKMCVQAAMRFALGFDHSDEVTDCEHKVLRDFKIPLNDAAGWPSNQARAEGLRPLIIASLGTAEKFDAQFFVSKMALYAVNKIVPAALRAAASVQLEAEHKAALETAAVNCEQATELNAAADAATYAAADAAADAATYAADAAHAARAATYAADAARAARAARAATDATRAADAAADAATYAADAAHAARAARAAADAARAADAAAHKILLDTINYAVSVLVEMKTPGSEFLDLAC